MNLQQELLEYYKENTVDFNNDIEELNNWSGYLGDVKVIPEERNYSDYLDEEFVQEIIDNEANLSLSSGVQDIIDKWIEIELRS